jgi:hypothetical protein
MTPKPKAQHSTTPYASNKLRAADRRADKALREHLSCRCEERAKRRVFNLGPISVDGGEPASALWRAVREVVTDLPDWLALDGHSVVYELGASHRTPATTRSATKRRSEGGEGGAPQHLSWVMHACRPSAPFPLEPVDARRTPSMHHVHSILVFLFRFEPPSPRPSPISP